MSDQDSAQAEKVNLLLDGIWQGNREMGRVMSDFLAAGDAFLAAVQADADIRRLQSLRQAVEGPQQRSSSHFRPQRDRIESLLDLLRKWKSPGQEYARFVEQARRLADTYMEDLISWADASEQINSAVDAFDDFLRAAGR